MKTPTLENNGVPDGAVETISLLMARIPWPERRLAMAEVTQHLLDGKPRVAEYVFGWNRETVKIGLEELRTALDHEMMPRHKLMPGGIIEPVEGRAGTILGWLSV